MRPLAAPTLCDPLRAQVSFGRDAKENALRVRLPRRPASSASAAGPTSLRLLFGPGAAAVSADVAGLKPTVSSSVRGRPAGAGGGGGGGGGGGKRALAGDASATGRGFKKKKKRSG